MWDKVVAFYENFVGAGMMFALFLAAEVYLFITEKNKTTRVLFLYVPAVLLVLFFCPFFAGTVYFFTGDEIYWRMLWLLPIVPVLAYAAVKIIQSVSGRKQIAAGVVLALIVMMCGKLVYKNPAYTEAQNIYHVPQAVVNICEAIREEENVRAAFPEEHLLYVRQYTEDIEMPYGREMIRKEWLGKNSLYDLMVAPVLDVAAIAEELRTRECKYVIFSEDKELNGKFEDYDFEFFHETDGYLIYKDMLSDK